MKQCRFKEWKGQKIRNEYIRGAVHVGKFRDKAGEATVLWFGHVMLRRLWVKDVRDGAARQEEKGKAKEEVYGHSEGGHAGSWCDGGRCGGQGKMDTDGSAVAEQLKGNSICVKQNAA